MTGMSNRAHEMADRLAESERATGVACAANALSGIGSEDCIDCGEGIPDARREALPSAKRCADCQENVERFL